MIHELFDTGPSLIGISMDPEHILGINIDECRLLVVILPALSNYPVVQFVGVAVVVLRIVVTEPHGIGEIK
jgi:hypothetical protein